MQIDIKKYKSIVFDCDGVVLDSNVVKTEAYFRTAKNLGATDVEAQALVDYHVRLGGISRYHKFDYYLREIVHQPVTDGAIQALLNEFARELEVGLMECGVADGLVALRDITPQANWMILSGGDQQEIRTLFAKRDLAKYFDGGLFGSPDNKDTVLAREKASGNLQLPALFIGDSKYDFEAATRAGLDFVFLSDWTEVADWKIFCAQENIVVALNVKSLLR
ncbi:MAG: HAD hydrolase-like protein [Methylotenera sp.]|nr:HAD hydrolase-like protein [Methylotenera sp.]MDO9233238.1 HAD hydrolase-like protein [Methylotenera sp.]MDO9389002.1 HAD hydrolase-like protein [Methylotenera sp.]MDP1597430.1 HAD hydrolase-like protein [Methylotenera sp.]MDP1754015.1 HAD hydrolase-like protein [Methylotenera sp.]